MAEKENQPQELPQKQPSSAPHGHEGGVEFLPGKSAWPEVVGLTAEEAERKIKEEIPANTCVRVVPTRFVCDNGFPDGSSSDLH